MRRCFPPAPFPFATFYLLPWFFVFTFDRLCPFVPGQLAQPVNGAFVCSISHAAPACLSHPVFTSSPSDFIVIATCHYLNMWPGNIFLFSLLLFYFVLFVLLNRVFAFYVLTFVVVVIAIAAVATSVVQFCCASFLCCCAIIKLYVFAIIYPFVCRYIHVCISVYQYISTWVQLSAGIHRFKYIYIIYGCMYVHDICMWYVCIYVGSPTYKHTRCSESLCAYFTLFLLLSVVGSHAVKCGNIGLTSIAWLTACLPASMGRLHLSIHTKHIHNNIYIYVCMYVYAALVYVHSFFPLYHSSSFHHYHFN